MVARCAHSRNFQLQHLILCVLAMTTHSNLSRCMIVHTWLLLIFLSPDWSHGFIDPHPPRAPLIFLTFTQYTADQWMLVMSTQLLGFSIGGILRRFLVQPPSMSAHPYFLGNISLTHVVSAVWPANLVTCALFNTLHSKSYAGIGTRGGISRERFFLYAWAAGVCWYFIPGYLFQALSYFSWVCWIAPDNIVVNQLFGYVTGLGMSLITFDWAQITYISEYVFVEWDWFADVCID